MDLSGRFSKLKRGVRSVFGYGTTEEPRNKREVVLDLRERVDTARSYYDVRNNEIAERRRYILGDGQKAKYLEELQDMDLEDEFVVMNYTRSLISHLISLITSSLGEAYVVPSNPEDPRQSEGADKLGQYLRALRKRDNYAHHMRQWLEDAAVTGSGWLRAVYDRWDEDVKLQWQDAATIYPEPNAATLDEAEFVAIRHVRNVGSAKRLWPDIDLEICEEAGPPRQQQGQRGRRMSTKQIEVWEVYHDFGDKLTIYSGDQLIFHGEAPITGAGFPLFHYTFAPSVHEIWGHSLLKDIEYLQDLFNRIMTRISWWQRYWANPNVKTNDPNANIKTGPGEIWYARPGHDIEPVHPPDFPRELFGAMQTVQEGLDTITGIQEVNRGQRPEGVTAGVALDLLRQTSEQRMQGPLEDATAVLADAFHYLLKLIQNYYTDEAMIPFVENGEIQTSRIEAPDLYGMETDVDEETGETVYRIKPHPYQILMQPPGDLPRSPAAKAELAMALFQMGAIDKVALLEAVKFEGRKEVLAREAQMMQAQMQGQVQGMQDRQTAEQQMMAQQAQQQQMEMLQ